MLAVFPVSKIIFFKEKQKNAWKREQRHCTTLFRPEVNTAQERDLIQHDWRQPDVKTEFVGVFVL